MKPKLTIIIKEGKISKMYSDSEIFLSIEIHDHDTNPELVEQHQHDPMISVHFVERLPQR
jgi:hypothetical protein